MPEFPIMVDLDRVEVDFHGGRVGVGTGTLHLTAPSGPVLVFTGILQAGPEEFMAAMGFDGPSGPPGELGIAPDRRFRGTGGGLRVEGRVVTGVRTQSGTTDDERLAIHGNFTAKLVLVWPDQGAPAAVSGPTHIEVHYLGLPSKRFQHSFLTNSPVRVGTAVQSGADVFYLHDSNGWLRKAIWWSDIGGFTYQGPARLQDESFMSPMVWRFSLLLGSALGTPVDAIGFVERDTAGNLVEARWWRPWKDHQRKPFWPTIGGDGMNGELAGNVRRWLEAGLAMWTHLESGHFGLELALLYMEKAPSQPRSEMRMRDLVIALERILRGRLRVGGIRPRPGTSLNRIFTEFHRLVGRPVFTDEQVDDFRRIRNALSHLGDLRDDRDFGLGETQGFAQTEGALLTACMRALAAVLEVDVLLHDLASVDLPLVSSSSTAFARPPIIPVDRH